MFRIRYFFFFNDTATTEIYTLSLHDALPISFCQSILLLKRADAWRQPIPEFSFIVEDRSRRVSEDGRLACADRKSTRLNSSHLVISYAVFCLKKKKLTDGCWTEASSKGCPES